MTFRLASLVIDLLSIACSCLFNVNYYKLPIQHIHKVPCQVFIEEKTVDWLFKRYTWLHAVPRDWYGHNSNKIRLFIISHLIQVVHQDHAGHNKQYSNSKIQGVTNYLHSIIQVKQIQVVANSKFTALWDSRTKTVSDSQINWYRNISEIWQTFCEMHFF